MTKTILFLLPVVALALLIRGTVSLQCNIDQASFVALIQDVRVADLEFSHAGGCYFRISCATNQRGSHAYPFCSTSLGGSSIFYFRCAPLVDNLLTNNGFTRMYTPTFRFIEWSSGCDIEDFNPGYYIRSGDTRRNAVQDSSTITIPPPFNATGMAQRCSVLPENNFACVNTSKINAFVSVSPMSDCIADLDVEASAILYGDCTQYSAILRSDCLRGVCDLPCQQALLQQYENSFSNMSSFVKCPTNSANKQSTILLPLVLCTVLVLILSKESKSWISLVVISLLLASDFLLVDASFSKDQMTAFQQVSCCNRGNACWSGDDLCGRTAACQMWEACRVQHYMRGVTISDCESLDFEC